MGVNFKIKNTYSDQTDFTASKRFEKPSSVNTDELRKDLALLDRDLDLKALFARCTFDDYTFEDPKINDKDLATLQTIFGAVSKLAGFANANTEKILLARETPKTTIDIKDTPFTATYIPEHFGYDEEPVNPFYIIKSESEKLNTEFRLSTGRCTNEFTFLALSQESDKARHELSTVLNLPEGQDQDFYLKRENYDDDILDGALF